MATTRRRNGLAATLLVAIAGLICVTPAQSVEPGYAGKIKGDPNSRIVFRIEWFPKYSQSYVRLDARRFDVTCTDPEADHELTLRWEQTKEWFFYSPRVFRGRFAIHPDPYPGYGGYYIIRGELKGHGRVKGTLSYSNIKPPSDGPSCETGTLHWTATKQR